MTLLLMKTYSKKLKQFDTFGKISKENSMWIFDIATKDKKLVIVSVSTFIL